MKHKKTITIKNYYYNYKAKAYNRKLISLNKIERNYFNIISNNSRKLIDTENNLFCLNHLFLKRKSNNIIAYMKKIMPMIENSIFTYDVELNYYYFKSKRKNNVFSHSNNYYEIVISCYDSNRKIGQEINFKFKRFKIKQLLNRLKTIESILKSDVDYDIRSIESNKLIISSFAFSQILSTYKKVIWQYRKKLNKTIAILSIPNGHFSYNNTFYNKKGEKMKFKNLIRTKQYNEISASKSLVFNNCYKVKNMNKELNTGYVITKMYFLNNSKEQADTFKALCSGYYIKDGIPTSVFSNKLYIFKIDELINGIKKTSKKKEFSNDFLCPDVYIDIDEP